MVEVAVYTGPKRRPTKINRGEAHWDTGDLVVARQPVGRIGRKERRLLLWLLVGGLPDEELAAMMEPEWEDQQAGILKRKTAHFIPLQRLESVSRIDVRRALDPQDPYQPFIIWESDELGRTAPATEPIDARELVYDKQTQERVVNTVRTRTR